MKMFDQDALDIADAVRDVIEGRIKKEVADPKAKGEKDFKDKHDIKKSGEKEDGTVTKEATISIDEAKKPGKGKSKADIDWIGNSSDVKDAEKKHKVKIKSTGKGMADVSGEKKNIIAMLSDPEIYGMDDDDIEELFPELYESKQVQDALQLANESFDMNTAIEEASKELGYTDVEEGEELSAKQKKYQNFFKKALAKFGAKSPQDLDKEKRAEFFDYIDKNYEADDEVAEDSAPMVEAPSTVIHAEMPFQLFDKAGTSMMFNLSKDWNVTAVAQSNDRYVAFAGEPRDLEKMLKNHPKLKGKVDVKAIMSTAVKFTGKEKFGRQKGANFTN